LQDFLNQEELTPDERDTAQLFEFETPANKRYLLHRIEEESEDQSRHESIPGNNNGAVSTSGTAAAAAAGGLLKKLKRSAKQSTQIGVQNVNNTVV